MLEAALPRPQGARALRHDVLHHQEVAREALGPNDAQLVVQARPGAPARRRAAVAPLDPSQALRPQAAEGLLFGEAVEGGKDEAFGEDTAGVRPLGQGLRRLQGFGHGREEALHLLLPDPALVRAQALPGGQVFQAAQAPHGRQQVAQGRLAVLLVPGVVHGAEGDPQFGGGPGQRPKGLAVDQARVERAARPPVAGTEPAEQAGLCAHQGQPLPAALEQGLDKVWGRRAGRRAQQPRQPGEAAAVQNVGGDRAGGGTGSTAPAIGLTPSRRAAVRNRTSP